MKALNLFFLLLLAAQAHAACSPGPENGLSDIEAPVVSLTATTRSNEFQVSVRASQRICLISLAFETVTRQPAPVAALTDAPTETRAVRAVLHGSSARYSFLVSSWLPAGETFYTLWFPVGPSYVALTGPEDIRWCPDGAAARQARIGVRSWGTLLVPEARPAVRPKPVAKVREKPQKASPRGKPPPKKPVRTSKRRR